MSLAILPLIVAATVAVAVGQTTPTSVTLTWTAPGDDGNSGTASQYDIRYSLSPITTDSWNQAMSVTGEPTPQAAGSQQSMIVEGLEPATTYYFGIRTADEVPNWSFLSNVISKTTAAEDSPPAAIVDLMSQNPTPSSVTLTWTAPGDDGSSGTAAIYDVRYATFIITDGNWSSATPAGGEPSPSPAGSTETFTVDGLDASTTYYFAVKTADEVPNISGLSNIAAGTTTEELSPPSTPVLASPPDGADDVASTIALDWSAAADAESYELQLSLAGTFTNPLHDTTTASTEVTVFDLTPGDTYYWRVRAGNAAGWSGWSNVWDFEVACDAPGTPVLVTPAEGTTEIDRPVGLDWGDVADAADYRLQLGDEAALADPVIDIYVDESSYEAAGLDNEKTYYWRVLARNACGPGSWSTIYSFTTRDIVDPAPVATLEAEAGDEHGQIILSWTAVGDDGDSGSAHQYDMRYATTGITAGNWNQATPVTGEPQPQAAGASESMVVSDLDASQRYYFAVRVSDESGNQSGLSNVVNAFPRDAQPPAPIMDLSAETGSLDGSIILSWTAPGGDGSSGIVAEYIIKYAREPIDEAGWGTAMTSMVPVTPLPSGATQTVTIGGLEAGEKYYLAARAVDRAGQEAALSNIASALAGVDLALDFEEPPVVPVGPLGGAAVPSTSPILAVRNIDDSLDNIYYFQLASDSLFFDAVTISPPVVQAGGDITAWPTMTELEPGARYFWRARVNDYNFSFVASFTVTPVAHAYPNPFDRSVAGQVTFTEIPDGSDVVMLSISGSLIRRWDNVGGDEFTWDGTNESGDPVSSGTYLWYIERTDMKGKIVVIR